MACSSCKNKTSFPIFLIDGRGSAATDCLVKPTQALRLFLKKHRDLRPHSSQLGFSNLVGRSESLVRAVEAGRLDMSARFAHEISEKIGVAREWLMEPSVTNPEIPAADGGPLRHDAVIARLKGGMARDTQQTAADPPSGPISGVIAQIQQRYLREPGRLELLIALGEAVARTIDKGDKSSAAYRVSDRFMREAGRKVVAPDRPAGDSSAENS